MSVTLLVYKISYSSPHTDVTMRQQHSLSVNNEHGTIAGDQQSRLSIICHITGSVKGKR